MPEQASPNPINAVSQFFGKVMAPQGDLLPLLVLAPIAVIVMIYVTRKVIELLTTSKPSLQMKYSPFILYDPKRNKLFAKVLVEIGPGIWASRDGDIIALVSEHAKPIVVDFLDPKRFGTNIAYYGILADGNVMTMSPLDEFTLELFEYTEKPIKTLDDLLISLVDSRIVSKIPINPNMRLALVIDKKAAAKTLKEDVGTYIANAIVQVTAVSGNLQNFREALKQMVEMELKKAESISNVAMKVAIGMMLAIIVLGAVMSFMGGGGAPTG